MKFEIDEHQENQITEEQDLLIAKLQRAYEDYHGIGIVTGAKNQAQAKRAIMREVEAWFRSDSRDENSFINTCLHLNIDPRWFLRRFNIK